MTMLLIYEMLYGNVMSVTTNLCLQLVHLSDNFEMESIQFKLTKRDREYIGHWQLSNKSGAKKFAFI